MENDIEALIQNAGSSCTFSRAENGNILFVARAGEDTYEAEGKTVHDAVVTVLTQARQVTNRRANPHLQP